MRREIYDRVLYVSNYIVETKKTIRDIANDLGISKSTVHLDLSKRLKKINLNLWERVNKILQNNFDNKHIKGGESTRKKYLLKKQNMHGFLK